MCGRVRLSSDVSEIKLVFSIPSHRPTPNFLPSWNVAPTDQLPVVRYDRKAGERSLDLSRWGLVPYWAKDIKVGFANINAKAEGIENRPAFREAFQRRRCLVPVDNFYEWVRAPLYGDTQTRQIWLAIPKLPKLAIKRALEYFSANDCTSGQEDKCDEDLAFDADPSPVPVHM